jgi:hypothetical protein
LRGSPLAGQLPHPSRLTGRMGHRLVGTNALGAAMYLETLKFRVCGEKACLAYEWPSVGIIPSANGTVTSPSI